MGTRYTTAELHGNITEHDKRIGTLEQGEVRQDERIGELRKDVNDVCATTKKLSDVVITSGVAIKIGTWIMAGFGISVIALIWSLVTGQASLIFK